MLWKPFPSTPRLLPFRTASAGTGRSNLMQKLTSRPVVAAVPQPSAIRAEGQDAVLSGMTRSLHRRLSGLNLPLAQQGVTMQRKIA